MANHSDCWNPKKKSVLPQNYKSTLWKKKKLDAPIRNLCWVKTKSLSNRSASLVTGSSAPAKTLTGQSQTSLNFVLTHATVGCQETSYGAAGVAQEGTVVGDTTQIENIMNTPTISPTPRTEFCSKQPSSMYKTRAFGASRVWEI